MATQQDSRHHHHHTARSAGQSATGNPRRPHRFRPRWRVFTWFVLAFNAFMLAWVVGVITSHASTCHGLTGSALTNCELDNTGIGIAATLLIVLWALGDVILGVLWLVTRPRTRVCPVCGNTVKRGWTQCRCGYDFALQARALPPEGLPPEQVQRPPAGTAGWGPPPTHTRERRP